MTPPRSASLRLAATACLAGVLTLAAGCGGGPRTVTPGAAEKPKARTCLSCHDDFAGLPSSHLAAGTDACASCHKPHGLVGSLKLKAAEPDLCRECHAEVEVGDGDHFHPAGQAACTSCHDPHRTEVADCASCHPGVAPTVPAHADAADGCLTCHRPHGGSDGGMLRQVEGGVCLSCHDSGAGAMSAAHDGIPLNGDRCTECHASHGQADQHASLRLAAHPTTRDGNCNACHEEASTALKAGDAGSTCRSCHESVPGEDLANTHMGVGEDMCLECHNPHAGPAAPVLRDVPRVTCTECHTDLSELRAGHAPVLAGQCLDCHSGHGSDEESLLVAAPGRELCETCHEDKAAAIDEAEVPHAPAEMCDTCHDGHGTGIARLLKARQDQLCAECHQELIDEISIGTPHAPVAMGACSSCHDPHGSEHEKLLLQKGGDNCLSCHKNHVPDAIGEVKHEPVEWKLCLSCHDPHSSRHGSLLKAPAEEVCLGCHASAMRDLEAAEVAHRPVAEGQCLQCHLPHGGTNLAMLRRPPQQVCLTCHQDIHDEASRQDTVHAPVTRGDCLKCHEGHQSNLPHLERKAPPELCADCHPLTTSLFREKHLGLAGTDMDCLSCHDKHGGKGRGMLLPEVHVPFNNGDCSQCHDLEEEK